MKSLDKNIIDPQRVQKQIDIQTMTARLLSACLRNDLTLASTVGVDNNGDFYITYGVRRNGENKDVFLGQARKAEELHYAFVLRAAEGKVVSELCPPAIPFVNPDGDSSVESRIPVAYWKRRLVLDHDVTNPQLTDLNAGENKQPGIQRESYWVGFNSKHAEIIRVKEGVENPGSEYIQSLRYVDLGPIGTVVAVLYKNDIAIVGKEPTLGQAIQEAEQKDEEKVVDLPESISCHDLAKMLKTDLGIVIRILKESDRFSAVHQKMNRLLAADVAAKLGWEVKPIGSAETDKKVIELPESITVSQLAKELNVESRIVIKELTKKGMFCTINQALDRETASIVVLHLGARARQPLKVVIPESIRIDELASLLGTPVLSVLRVLEELCVPGIKTSNVSRVLDDNTAEQAAMALGFEVSKPEAKTPAQRTEEARQKAADEVAKLKAQAAKKKGDLTKLVGRRRVLYAAEYAELDDTLKAHYRQLLAEFGKKALNGMSEEGTLMVTAGNYCHRILDSEFLRKEWEESVPFSGPKLTLDYYIAKMVDWSDKLFFAVRGAQAPKYVKAPSKKTGVTPVEGRKATAKVAVKKPSSRKPTEKKEDGETSIE